METEEIVLKPIPDTMGFLASNTGLIFDSERNLRNQYKNLDGYKTASVKLINGKWQTFGVHRLVALAHIPDSRNLDELVVNHIDKNLENNIPDNLEWVTVHLNNLHSSLMSNKIENHKLVIIYDDSRKILVKNIPEASEILSLDFDTVWKIIKDSSVFKNFKIEILQTIPEELRKKQKPVFDENGRIKKIELFLKDLESGEITSYSSMKELAEKFNVTSSHIHQCITEDGKVKLFKRQYLISKTIEDIPDIDPEEYFELKNPTGRQTFIYIKNTDTLAIFDSASKMIKHLNLSKKAITTRLRKSGVGEIDNYIFAYGNMQKEFLDRVKISRSSI